MKMQKKYIKNSDQGLCFSGVRTSDSRDRFPTRQIRHMDEGVIERGVDVCDTENEFAFRDLRTERDGLLLPWCLGFLRWLDWWNSFVFDDVLDGFVKFVSLNVIQMSSSPSTHQTYKEHRLLRYD